MASDKFGNNPVAPLYNATGRNPRDMDMGNPGKPLGSVGSSGAGGKDFGIPGKQAQAADLGASYFSPLNQQNLMWGDPLERRGGGRSQRSQRESGKPGAVYDADGREYDMDAYEKLAGKMTIINNQNSGYLEDRSFTNTGDIKDIAEGANVFSAVGEGAQLIGDRNTATATGSTPEPATAPNKPTRVKTPQQRERDRETAKARRALRSDIQKSGTSEQKERIAKEGITGRKNAKPKPTTKRTPAAPAAPTSSRPQPSIKVENTGSNTIINGPGASDFRA
jgi:pyruvate/2-oxoglutarate dehydrogenase complex dihydrolipoamide acyltransferase (E2) component